MNSVNKCVLSALLCVVGYASHNRYWCPLVCLLSASYWFVSGPGTSSRRSAWVLWSKPLAEFLVSLRFPYKLSYYIVPNNLEIP